MLFRSEGAHDRHVAPIGEGRTFASGKDASKLVIAKDGRCEYRAPIEVGPWVAVLSVVPNWRVDGRPQEMRWLEVFHVVDGRIRELRLHK